MLQSPIGVDKDIKFKWVGGGSRNLDMVIHVYIEFYIRCILLKKKVLHVRGLLC